MITHSPAQPRLPDSGAVRRANTTAVVSPPDAAVAMTLRAVRADLERSMAIFRRNMGLVEALLDDCGDDQQERRQFDLVALGLATP